MLFVWTYTDETSHSWTGSPHGCVSKRDKMGKVGPRYYVYMGLTDWRPSLWGSRISSQLISVVVCRISSQLISVVVCSTFRLPALLLHCASFQSSHRYFSFVFVCLNICAHHQDPLLSLNSEVTQLSLTWKKCLTHPLEYCTVSCHFLNLYSDMTSMIKHTKKKNQPERA